MEALALKEGVIRPVFTLQGRFYEFSCNSSSCPGATVHQGLAFGDSNLAFQVSKSLLLAITKNLDDNVYRYIKYIVYIYLRILLSIH